MKREELLEELRIAVDVLLDDGYMREKGMVIKAIEAALTALQSEREAVVRECATTVNSKVLVLAEAWADSYSSFGASLVAGTLAREIIRLSKLLEPK